MLVALFSSQAFSASSVTLAWDANTEPDLTGYTLHYGTASRSYGTQLPVGNITTKTVAGLADCTQYFFAVTARDTFGNESGYSNEVAYFTPGCSVETIAAPAIPTGPASGSPGVAYVYIAAGASSSTGEPLQYRFLYSDNTNSGWLATGTSSAAKTWNAAGSYTVRAEARCAAHTTIVSPLSPALAVTISAPAETVSTPTRPSGPASGLTGSPYTYTTGGSVSSAGHAVEYRFNWSDGYSSAWLPAPASAAKIWNSQGTWDVRAEARCAQHPSSVSALSTPLSVAIAPAPGGETVSTPDAPTGYTNGYANTPYVFSSGNAASTTGDPVQYRFLWGDGTVSDWVGPGQPVKAAKTWTVPGVYDVKTEAACVNHPSVSKLSAVVKVSIVPAIMALPVACEMLSGAKIDFDGDGRDDIGCYYAPGGNWYIYKSQEGFMQVQFGFSGTIPITGDFDGDGRSDFGVYYPPGGNWYIFMSKQGFWETQFGYAGTIPVVGDFDGDGKDDFGCYYPPGGNWYVFKSKEGFWETKFGYAGTLPVVGDFDGDGRDDIGCYYPPGGNWYVFKSKEGFWETQFGYAGTLPVVGDFDRDGRDDFGCYYPAGGNWYAFKSKEGFWQGQFGYAGTRPVVGDFNGDDWVDFGVYDQRWGNWLTLSGAAGL